MRRTLHQVALAVLPFAVMLLLPGQPIFAQHEAAHTGHQTKEAKPAVDHAAMGHPGMTPVADDAPEKSAESTTESMPTMDHGAMGHGAMKMQGGSAPEDARDPHAYSGGYTLHDGPYALEGPVQLHMMDQHNFWSLMVDRLEWTAADEDFIAYDAQAWFGKTYRRLVLKAEGEYADGQLEESSTELLFSQAMAPYWDLQAGIRYDAGDGPNRSWLAAGIQGLMPYWFETDLTAYLGENGRTALTLELEYELLITQRLILQPRVELNLYGKKDIETAKGSGLSDAVGGLRLRYEFSRQFAPYVGIEWAGMFGDTADFAADRGEAKSDLRFVAGLRFWL